MRLEDVELGKRESLDLLSHFHPNGQLPRARLEPRLAVGLARLPDWPARLDPDLGAKILEFRLRELLR